MTVLKAKLWLLTFAAFISFSTANRASLFPHLENLRSQTPKDVQQDAVLGLISRLIPGHASKFQVVIEPAEGSEAFTVISTDDQVTIYGTGGVVAAWGFHYYLKEFCGCHISWDADQLSLPEILPPANVTIVSLDKFRYYQNVCTVSYSSAWWQWPRWEREIDWMAMQGINMPLAFTAQEAIWKRVFLSLGLTEEELTEHFTGPAFLAWERMGNLRGWAGPLSDSWHSQQLVLQHSILKRMRDFGMFPVLPAFAGHVPRNITRLFPDADITTLTPWNNFQNTYTCPGFLQPTDPLFATLGTAFVNEMAKEFNGTDHIYNCDMFNEMRPQNSTPAYIQLVGQAVFSAMTQADPDAVWMMQGWLFFSDGSFWTEERSKALLTSVPLGRMLVLDLQAELNPQYVRLESFYGQPYIFCLLHNFGGTKGMYGTLPLIAPGVLEARKNSTLVGTGLTMEGIFQNYIVYDLMLEMGYRDVDVILDTWVEGYWRKRYGVTENTHLSKAWMSLQRSVYNASARLRYRGRTVLSRSPQLNYNTLVGGLRSLRANFFKRAKVNSVYGSTSRRSFHGLFLYSVRPDVNLDATLWYSIEDVISAWDDFVFAMELGVSQSATFRHDLVDLTRQVLQDTFSMYYEAAMDSYKRKNITTFRTHKNYMLELLQDLDRILVTSPNFLLGSWIEDAKSWAQTVEEEEQYEYNARNQITLWGPNGEILDYATKQWAGVVADYYAPRWLLFLQMSEKSIESGVALNRTEFRTMVFNKVERPFTFSSKPYTTTPIGDTFTTVREIFNKWRPRYTALHKTLRSVSVRKPNAPKKATNKKGKKHNRL